MKFFQYKFLLLFTLFLSFTSLLFSQQQPDTLKAELDPVLIQAFHSEITIKDAPLAFSVNRRTLKERSANPAFTLDEITATLPGIWVNNRENYALGERITIRGMGWRASFGVRGIQVIMDDIPLTVADGQSMLNSVDPSFIERVEVIRGPASSFWGNSSGGVLYLSTPTPSRLNNSVSVRSSFDSFGAVKQDIHISDLYGNHKVTGYGSYFFDEGYRDHSTAKIFRSGLKGSVEINDNDRLEYIGAFVAMPKAEHPSSLTKEQAAADPTQANSSFQSIGAGKEVYQAQAGVNYHKDSSLGFMTFTGYGIYRDLRNPLPFAIITLDRWAGGLRGTLEKNYNNLEINTGFDLKLQHDDRVEYDNNNGSRGSIQVDQIEEVSNQALFLTSKLNLEPFSILGGLRYDWLTFSTDADATSKSGKRTFQSLNPSIGLSLNLNDTKLYTNLSSSFEAPTTTELVNNPNQQGGFNPSLEPEKTTGIDAGIKGELLSPSVSYDLALYKLWIRDLLFPFQLQQNGPIFFRNQGETVHQGIETTVTAPLNRPYYFTLSYNYTDATFQKALTLDGESLEGNRVPGIPKHRLNLSATYSPTNWLISTSYNYVSDYPADNLNTAFNDEYSLVNAKISYRYTFSANKTTIQPFINVRNIFDTQYNGSVVINAFGGRYFEPAAGRNWQFGLSLQI